MFKVRWNENHDRLYMIYNVRTLENGMMQLLTYDFGKWLWLPASEYSPLDYPAEYLEKRENNETI